MNAHRQGFPDHSATARTALRGAVGINQYARSTSFFRFVEGEARQLMPGSIRNTLRQTVVVEHPLGVQFFQGDEAVGVDHGAGELVGKVLAP